MGNESRSGLGNETETSPIITMRTNVSPYSNIVGTRRYEGNIFRRSMSSVKQSEIIKIRRLSDVEWWTELIIGGKYARMPEQRVETRRPREITD